MNTNIFVVFSLTLTLGLSYFYAELRDHFNPLDQYKEKVVSLEKRVKEERFKHLLTSYEFADFRNHVATLLPEAIKEKGGPEKSQEKTYTLRSLASVVQKSTNENIPIARAKSLFEDGKKLFRDKKYNLANRIFAKVIHDHPYSAYIPEALFLLVEGHFSEREYDEAVSYANQMIDLFPNDDLCAYTMLRLGKIYELEDRHEEAIEIYKTVLKSFPTRDVASVANQSLRAVEL